MEEKNQKEDMRCENCGALMLSYATKLNRGMVVGLWKLSHLPQPASRRQMKLTVQEYNSLYFLQFWKLAYPEVHQSGWWRITELGLRFLYPGNKICLVRSHIRIYRGKFQQYEGGWVTAGKCWKDFHYDRYEDYLATAIIEPPQGRKKT